MASKPHTSEAPKPKRAYTPPGHFSGIRGPQRDLHNFSDLDRACERWLRKHDPEYHGVPTTYIDYDF